MRQIFAATVLALAIATPALAQTTNDYNTAATTNAAPVTQVQQNAAVTNRAYGTDAAIRSKAQDAASMINGPAGYGPGVGCPATNQTGQLWQPGQYCFPGGR